MANIIIMDDNRSTGALLKKALECDDHQVCLVDNWQGLTVNTQNPPIDLVLIHQTHKNNSGWETFNQLKRTNQQIPAMLYVFPDYRWASMDWIVRAVHETLPPSKKYDGKLPLWDRDSGFNDAGTGHIAP